jgi:flagellar motility protein MotE (MotC chaperone)
VDDDEERHINHGERLATLQEKIDGMDKRMSKVEQILENMTDIANKSDIAKLIDAMKGKNSAVIAAIIGGFCGLAGTLFGLLKP